MILGYIVVILIGFLVGIPLLFFLKKTTLRYKVFMPRGIPLLGGMAIWLSFFSVCLVSSYIYKISLGSDVRAILFASFIMLIFGIIDDWRELSVSAKFLAQIIAVSLLIFSGIKTHIVYIGNLLNITITLIWILGITNAFNHLDVMDGLTAITAVIVSCAFVAVALLNGDMKTAILVLSLIGGLVAFLIYNLPPAKIYLGNSGSHLLGFILAAIAILISYAPMERKIALFSPLIILGFPIFDTVFLVFMRLSKRRIPFKKSNDHLALRFLALGYSKKKALFIMTVISLFFSASGALLSQVSNTFGIMVIIFVILVSLVSAKKAIGAVVND